MELAILAIVLDGFFLGIITGLVGVGGGFLLVAALTRLAALPVHAAIGTSLFIIALQSAAGLAGHASQLNINFELTALITSLAIVGSFIGSKIAPYIAADLLKRSFGYFVLLIGSGLLMKEVNQDVLNQLKHLIAENQQFIIGVSFTITLLLLYRFWAWLHTKMNKI